RQYLGRRLAGLEQLGAGRGMRAHRDPLGVVERARLCDDLRWDRELAQVVDGRGELEELQLTVAEAELASDTHADRGDAPRMLQEGVVRFAGVSDERVEPAGVDPMSGRDDSGCAADRPVSLRSGFHR